MTDHIDERAHARMREARHGLVARPALEEYGRKYARYFTMKREAGILEVHMHSEGGPAIYDLKLHSDWAQLWYDIGNDPENELLIFSGSGDKWLDFSDRSTYEERLGDMASDSFYEHQFADAMKLLESLIFNVDIPTISCINGPGMHTEFALLFDITLCADHAVLFDPHFELGLVPGDGQGLVFQELLGIKRAAYYLYTGERIDARTALELGLVNEVLALDELLPRARAIAVQIMKQPRTTRRLTASVLRRPWKRRLVQDLGHHMAHEMMGIRLDRTV